MRSKNQPESDKSANKKAFGSRVFDGAKKFLGFLDAAWGGIQSVFLSNIVHPIIPLLTGIFGFVVHIGEGIQGGRDAYLAYNNEKIRQRKTRILTNALAFIFAAGGVGMALAYTIGTAAAVVSGTVLNLASIIIPGLLVAIYGLALWRNAYIFSQAKIDEAATRKVYLDYFAAENKLRKEIQALQKKSKALGVNIPELLKKKSAKLKLSEAEQDAYKIYKKLSDKRADLAQMTIDLKVKKQQLDHSIEQSFRAARSAAFNSADIATSSLALVATILGATALIGASVASFGIVPLVLLLVGIAGSVALQLFEAYDEKNNFAYTRKLRNWVSPPDKKLSATNGKKNNYVSSVYKNEKMSGLKAQAALQPPQAKRDAPLSKSRATSPFLREAREDEAKAVPLEGKKLPENKRPALAKSRR